MRAFERDFLPAAQTSFLAAGNGWGERVLGGRDKRAASSTADCGRFSVRSAYGASRPVPVALLFSVFISDIYSVAIRLREAVDAILAYRWCDAGRNRFRYKTQG